MRASSRKLLIAVVGAGLLGFLAYRARGFFHFGDFSGARLLHVIRDANLFLLALSVLAIYGCYALRALRWGVFQQNLGPSRFSNIYAMTLAGFSAVFLLGRAGEPIRPLLLARKEKLPISGEFGIYVLERLFDAASTAVIAAIGLLLFESHAHAGETAGKLQTAAKTTGSVLFAGVLAAVLLLVYLRVHGTALLERRLRPIVAAHGWKARFAVIILEFARGVQTIRTWGQLALAVLYSTAHWFLVLLVYLWVSHSFGGKLAGITLSDAMLVMAFTLVGSAVQVPGVGGGSQAGSIIAYTAIFGVEREPAVAAAIVLWLISFAMCSVVGLPLLIHQGWSLGELRQMAKQEKASELQSAPGEIAE
ncbi:MAG TPA: lysylphosphatidylglycerol synthase transmembrane domain-containing protein [Candidatus Acidoferrum sp.]|nr:lysylphosphatidylglycerol synthase transmembrane domain-containing protein [Candidatus Acidoferrum sp.]